MILIRLYWIIEFLYLLTKTTKKDQAEVVLWVPKVDIYYPFRTAFVWDLEITKQILKQGKRLSIRRGLKSVGAIQNKRVYYNPQYDMNIFKISHENYIYPIVSELLENGKNIVSPNAHDILLWENKKEMYTRFAELDISHPETKIIFFSNEIERIDLKEDYIIKPAYSKSSIGIKKAKSHLELQEVLDTDGVLILQKIEDIIQDSRVIVIGDQIVLQYWRKKVQTTESEEFITTATGNGSKVTFNDFSPQLEAFVLQNTSKIGLKSAAWDIIEVDGKLKALEVSPVYYPNSNRGYDENTPYRDYKNRWSYQFDMRYEFSKHIEFRLLCENS